VRRCEPRAGIREVERGEAREIEAREIEGGRVFMWISTSKLAQKFVSSGRCVFVSYEGVERAQRRRARPGDARRVGVREDRERA
jgi:hypothetical protein